jgi:hypothetical protein
MPVRCVIDFFGCGWIWLLVVSTTALALAGAEAAEVVVATAKALESRVPVLAGEGPLLLTAALLELLFSAQYTAA